MASVWAELKRRNVVKVAVAYVVVGWLLVQVAEFATEEAVEHVKALVGRPAVEGARNARFLGRGLVPLAE